MKHPARVIALAWLLLWLGAARAEADPGLTGKCYYYAPGVMERVARNRSTDLAGYADGVALMDCSHIGEVVWLERAGRPTEGPFLVIDCATWWHYPRRVANGDVAEVGWRTAARWHMRGPIPVTVHFEAPGCSRPPGRGPVE